MPAFSEIRFERKSYDDGFGFECMKTAYRLRIKGRMDYSASSGVRILMEGDEKDVIAFIEWIEQNIQETIHTLQHTYLNYSGHFTEFDIYRHTA